MLMSLLNLILGTLCGLLSLAFLARFVMQWARAPFYNPVGRFVIAITDWAVKPLRRIVPGLFNLDFASLLPAWLVQVLYWSIIVGIGAGYGGRSAAVFAIVAVGTLETLHLAVQLISAVVIISALLSWINPFAPTAAVFHQVAAPFLRPVQRILPGIGGVDLSPLVVLLLLQAVSMMLNYWRANLLPFWVS